MQLVLSNNRVIAHGENFLALGGVVINTETGAKYENATIAECDGCPSDIDKVGYKYHAGAFVPCAPFAGNGNNNGFFMEVCEDCATPRNSGIPIKGGLKLENMADSVKTKINHNSITLLWTNASPTSAFNDQTITLSTTNYDFYLIEALSTPNVANGAPARFLSVVSNILGAHTITGQVGSGAPSTYGTYITGYNTWCYPYTTYRALYYFLENGYYKMFFGYGGLNNTKEGTYPTVAAGGEYCIPTKIYGVKL